ncbi:hypothetical protein PVAP13_8NG074601 [Panicum virgatum]|uniref:Uncharacterized protein n=1 Tax=Panicum virgatum TaxID=38727 RepID=A0A8T0P6J5_PANVG|nr:hypothetical protein PVAP13_8NG074601 [Panicum virgatum]
MTTRRAAAATGPRGLRGDPRVSGRVTPAPAINFFWSAPPPRERDSRRRRELAACLSPSAPPCTATRVALHSASTPSLTRGPPTDATPGARTRPRIVESRGDLRLPLALGSLQPPFRPTRTGAAATRRTHTTDETSDQRPVAPHVTGRDAVAAGCPDPPGRSSRVTAFPGAPPPPPPPPSPGSRDGDGGQSRRRGAKRQATARFQAGPRRPRHFRPCLRAHGQWRGETTLGGASSAAPATRAH